MKKYLSLILALFIVLSVSACGKKTQDTSSDKIDKPSSNNEIEESISSVTDDDTREDSDVKPEEKPDTKPDTKPQAKPETKPQAKPETKPQAKPETKPQTKPEIKPETKPDVKPETKPEPTPDVKPETKPETNKSLGNVLLEQFKSIASSASALSVAEKLVANPNIKFSGCAQSIEPGFLAGFGDNEINEFKEGAMFGPIIGTIPFVGYVFTLDDASKASSFISGLRSSANLNWNICTTADEMVTGSVGDKVFFVMCPKSFD